MNTDQPPLENSSSSLPSIPSDLSLLIFWFRLGIQSFGGGSATLALIRRAVIDDMRWVSASEFARYWGLVMMVPGINLLGLTVLIGKKTKGAKGVILAVTGLLVPSTAITVMLTALYAKVQHSRLVVEALSGVVPATIGMGIVNGIQIIYPSLKNCLARGIPSLTIAVALFAGSALVELFLHWPVVAILLSSGAIGAATKFAGTAEEVVSE